MSRGLRVWGAVALLASTLSCGARFGVLLSYGIGTTAAKGTGNAADYWSQLVWLSLQ